MKDNLTLRHLGRASLYLASLSLLLVVETPARGARFSNDTRSSTISPVAHRNGAQPAKPISMPYAWGDASYGELGNGATGLSSIPVSVQMPASVHFVSIAAGSYHAIGLDGTGHAWAWGANGFGQLGNGTTSNSPVPAAVNIPAGIQLVTAAGGSTHTAALDSSGNAWAWGRNFSGQLGNGGNANSSTPVAVNMPAGLHFKAIAGGEGFTVALDNNGQAWAWGYNGDGELGNGSTTNSSVPVAVNMPAGVSFTAIASGSYHTIALDGSGTVWTWGFNASGQLGDNITASSSTPVQVHVSAGTIFTAIAAGSDHSLALDQNGHAWAWGNNFEGQLGNGSTTNSSVPVAVDMPTGVIFTKIIAAAGSYHSAALDQDGRAWDWGDNFSGELGNGTTTMSTTPVMVALPASTSFTVLAIGSYHSVALDPGGNAWTWGDNQEDELGNGTMPAYPTAVMAKTATAGSFTAVSAGAGYSLALDTDGHAWAWGYNGNGQLGNGTTTTSSVPVPVSMPPGVTFTAIAAHFYHSVALDTNGQAWAWGYNADGELGDGTTTDRSVPVAVIMPPGVKFTAIASGGGGHSLALDTSGQAWAWGYNGNGELGDGTTSNSSVPVAVAMPPLTTFVAIAGGGNHNPSLVAPGQDHSLAIDSNSHIWAWGANSYGQLGNELAAGSSRPVLVAMPLNATFTSVAGDGGPHSLALDNSGNAWAWGNGYFGELGDGKNGSTANASMPTAVTMPPGVSFTAIAGGGGHSLALDSIGNVWGWGENTSGQDGNGTTDNTNVPVQVTSVARATAIAAGVTHSLSLAPPPVQLAGAVSRMTHGDAGTFDIDLTSGNGIECRSGGNNGDYTVVFSFVNPLTSVGGVTVTAGTGSIVNNSVDPSDAHNYIVNLTGVTNAQTITVSLSYVTDSAGDLSTAVSTPMPVLIGDTNGDGFVNSADIGQTKSQSGQPVTTSNFREDVNVDGFINSADIGLVKSKSGTAFTSGH